MAAHSIRPERVTKPIQLLAAWLAGLVAVDSVFLVAASKLEACSASSTALVVAAILNVPGFLILLFLLQTKYRAEQQEDRFYAEHLKRLEAVRLQRTRVAELLKQVADIAGSRAIELASRPPITRVEIERMLDQRDPPRRRAHDPDVARELLKMTIVLIQSDDDALDAWEAALRVAR